MIRSSVALAIFLGLTVFQPSGTTSRTNSDESEETDAGQWRYSLEVLTYLEQHARDYANPNFSVDHGWLHLETRYNYESLKTGSVWLGYNFKLEEELKFESTPALDGDLTFKFTPMVGGVFGDITGVAPGYSIEVEYRNFYFATQGEYFVDAAVHSGNFFYSWSELRYYPVDCFWVGLAIDRTKVLGEEFDVRRGPLIGYKIQKKDIELTAYWLSPGSHQATFVFAVTHEF